MKISKKVKGIINNFMSKFGYRVSKLENGFTMHNNIMWLESQNINTIFDIGANEGQFAKYISGIFPYASIYSFEPINSCYLKLNELSKINNRIIPLNYALGDKIENIMINVNEFTPSSSILDMKARHIENFPYTEKSVKKVISVKTIDSVIKDFTIKQNVLVKIDVQGYEAKVLAGGEYFFANIPNLVIIETSIVQLYESEPLFYEMINHFQHLDYYYKGSLNQLYSPLNGEILQADLIFERKINSR